MAIPADLNSTLIRVAGRRRLGGRVRVQGSKNIALHLYAATLLADEPVVLESVPAILDTGVCAAILTHTGAPARLTGATMTITPSGAFHPEIHPQLGGRVRTTAVLAAAALARAGRIVFPRPGGDAFCPRLIDRHLAAMRAAGATLDDDGTMIRAVCGPAGVRAFRVDVSTPYGPSLGATVTAMLLAARAPGTSLITHPSIEPEVTETGRFLAERGVGVAWTGCGLEVTGSDRISGGTFGVAGDRIEAATLVLAAAATGGGLILDGVTTADLPQGLLDVLLAAGITLDDDGPHSLSARLDDGLRAVRALTGPHPGLPSDTAPQLTAALTQARGISRIGERVYPNRDTHLPGLAAFGADLTLLGGDVRVRGPVRLRAAQVGAADIRAVTALLIAALAAEGTSTIAGMYHLQRGYGHLPAKLATLGADITIDDAEAA